jgi:hypothetical protein
MVKPCHHPTTDAHRLSSRSRHNPIHVMKEMAIQPGTRLAPSISYPIDFLCETTPMKP